MTLDLDMDINGNFLDQTGNILDNDPIVRAIIVYNPMDTSDRTIADIIWEPGKTLDQYLDGLPEDQDWTIYALGRKIDRDEWSSVSLSPRDNIIVGFTPNKGVGQILGIIALVALAFAAPYIAGGVSGLLGSALGATAAGVVGTIVSSAVVLAGGLLISSMMSTAAKSASALAAQSSGSAYGLDGPKNTASEGICVPVVYGTMRIGGNKVNEYTENTIDSLSQALFIQYVVSEGPIAGISAVQVNGQDVALYPEIGYDTRLGVQTQLPMPWFSETISLTNIQARLTQTPYYYTTSTEVDRIRLDFEFPNGLYIIDPNGNIDQNTVNLYCAYTMVGGDGVWHEFGGYPNWYRIDASTNNTVVSCTGLRLTVRVIGNDGEPSTAYDASALFKIDNAVSGTTGQGLFVDSLLGGASFVGAQSVSLPSNAIINSYNSQYGSQEIPQGVWCKLGEVSGQINNTLIVNDDGTTSWRGGIQDFVFEVSSLTAICDLEFQVFGCVFIYTDAYFNQNASFTGSSRITRRESLTSPPLIRGTYQVQVLRLSTESTLTTNQDQILLLDIGQVSDQVINYVNTAYYGVVVRLGSGFNGEPSCTALVQGKLVYIYDRVGQAVAYRYSDNPADIALDIMLSTRNRFAFNTSRIDFPAFDNLRQYCNNNGLLFNGVFDTTTNVWDALVTVLRVGRASPVMQGLKWSVLIEGPADPVMMFTQDNIIKDSFQNEWTGRSGRANLIEVQYWDAGDNYNQHSVFALDDTFISTQDALVQSTVQLIGVNNAYQAQNEAYLLLNLNRYLTQSCVFDVYLQAMGCIVGDVVYVQHDMPQWGYSAMITGVSGNNITIDSEIPGQGLTGWRMMIMRSVSMFAVGYAQSISNNQVQVTGIGAAFLDSQDTAAAATSTESIDVASNVSWPSMITNGQLHRVMIGGQDYEVVDHALVDYGVVPGNTSVVIVLDRPVSASPGAEIQMFTVDYLAEANIAPFNAGDTLTVTSWNSNTVTPQVGDRVLMGQALYYRKPFRITKISYRDDHSRTISAIEYNATVYGANPQPTPNYSGLSLSPSQVLNLTATQTTATLQGGNIADYAVASWNRPLTDPRGYAGANVYLSVNGAALSFYQQIPASGQQSSVQGNVGDSMLFKVVAFYNDGSVADYKTAPLAAVTLGLSQAKPPKPTNFAALGGIRQIALSWTVPPSDYIKWSEVHENTTADVTSSYLMSQSTTNFYVRAGLAADETRFYWVRTVSVSNEVSDWVGPISATTVLLLTDDLSNAIINTAKFAQGLIVISAWDTAANGGQFPANPGAVNGNLIILNEADHKLYRWDGTEWVASVPAVDLTGVLTADQIADAAINTAKFAQGIQPVALWDPSAHSGNLPTGPSDVAGNSIFFNEADSQLYRWDGTKWVTTVNTSSLAGTITTTQIADSSISTPKLQAGAVTTDTLAANSVTTSKITANSISTGLIQAGAITSTELAAGAVSAGKLAAGAVTAGTIAAGAITAGTLAANSVVAGDLAANSVTTSNLTANCITAGQISAGAVGADQIAANSIHSNMLASDFVLANNAQFGTAVIHNAQIDNLAVGTGNIDYGSATTFVTSAASGAYGIGSDLIAFLSVAISVVDSTQYNVLMIRLSLSANYTVAETENTPAVTTFCSYRLMVIRNNDFGQVLLDQNVQGGELLEMVTDSGLGAGVYTYWVYISANTGYCSVDYRRLNCTGYKR